MWDDNLGVVYYDYRYYNPIIGQWTTRDSKLINNTYAIINNKILFLIEYLGNVPASPSNEANNTESLDETNEVKTAKNLSHVASEATRIANEHNISWITKALKEIPETDTPAKTEKRKEEYVKALNCKWSQQHILEGNAWCGCFVNWAISDIEGTRPEKVDAIRAFKYKQCWEKINEPVFGAIAIMEFSHVTFIVGFTNDKKEIYALGGNQSSKVKIERYDRKK